MAITYPDEPDLQMMRRRRLRRIRLGVAGLGVVAVAAVVAGVMVGTRDPVQGDPGSLTESVYRWEGEIPRFTDVTAAWGLGGWRNTAAGEASGGLAIGDVDGDGLTDVLAAGGDAVLFLGIDGGFAPGRVVAGDTVAVDLADLDDDGRLDLLLAREAGPDLIVWGDTVFAPAPVVTELESGDPSTGLIAADYDGDGAVDVLRLGYGRGRAAPDVIWRQTGPRSFLPDELPNSRRRSLAAAVADIDGVGGLDIWVTRDVGWQQGGDSLYVHDRSPTAPWADVAPDVGTAVEIDGMGVAVADFSGDGQLDVYLSDLGDNELLRRTGLFLTPGEANFFKDDGRGLARIRPPNSAESVVSSSWASGVADLNLDGILDLVVVNGGFASPVDNKIAGTEVALADPPSLFLGLGGPEPRWADVWSDLGIAWNGAARGLALGDLDGDGDTDIVISTRDAGLRVLRNDATASSVTFRIESGCDPTGVFINAFGAPGPYLLPVAAPTFLGRHASEFILGAPGDLFVPSGDLSRGPSRYTVGGGSGRTVLTLTCADVGRAGRG